MFGDKELLNYVQTSSTLSVNTKVFAEWNMNIQTNFFKVGNYRYRPLETSPFSVIPNTFDDTDAGGYYAGATDADVLIDGGYDNSDMPITFTSPKLKHKTLFSLEDCLGKFRPRSGINKAMFFPGHYLHHSHPDMYARPRYYIANKKDTFKYWTSYRTESGIERGISQRHSDGSYKITDAAPFVVYEEDVPTNRIVIKMQTHIGSKNLGPFYNATTSIEDPFYANKNAKVPQRWKIQYLEGNQWKDAIEFLPTSARANGNPIIGSDGYVEIFYGLKVPEVYRSTFNFKSELISSAVLPGNPTIGDAYLVRENNDDLGTFYIYTSTGYKTFVPAYGWNLLDGDIVDYRNTVEKISNPYSYKNILTNTKEYRQFKKIRGIRVVVSTMNTDNSTFDLIEMSPRLFVDLTDMVENVDVTKSASDLGVSGMPVSQLLASTGSLSLFDYDYAFSDTNKNSIVAPYLSHMIKVLVYEQIITDAGKKYLIPIKHLYSSQMPQLNISDRTVKMDLRDLMFLFENTSCPDLLLTDVSLSVAICTLLDSVGFSNYKFYRVAEEKELIIPYFFVNKDLSVAQALQQLAISSQSAMFFDEENNLVVMSKNYMMPQEIHRNTDFIVSGEGTGLISANIEEMSTNESSVFNDGAISYKNLHIQRTYGSVRQAGQLERDQVWVYKPVMLWEASGGERIRAINGEIGNSSAYTLSAIPLKSDLLKNVPLVVNNQITNNIFDVGEQIKNIGRYNGYFYANGEIIKYDAVEFSTSTGNVWIQNVQEYADYFAKISFNGKLYATGRIRIFAEPYYETINGVTRFKNGEVAKHGRGQFGTPVVDHYAGLSREWDIATVRGCRMDWQGMLGSVSTDATSKSKAASVSDSGIANTKVATTGKSGIIKNVLSATYVSDKEANELKSPKLGSVQASALVLEGATYSVEDKPYEYISYVPKQLDSKFIHFGTRMRLIGKPDSTIDKIQTPNGSMSYFSDASVGAASGGLAVMVNPSTNVGYYFEIMALTKDSLENMGEQTPISNIVFYKVKGGQTIANAIKLWEGSYNILVDDGNWTGQARVVGEDNPTVYDLAVEYSDKGGVRRFYLYINNVGVAIVDDYDPLPVYNNFGPFIRGTSRAMFEHVYALTQNHASNSLATLETPINSIFGDDSSLQTNEVLRKYAVSGAIQSTYLSGVSSATDPKYNIYFEEFGTILREAAYFDIRFDKAFPALLAKISPVLTGMRGYTVSGFVPSSYGAEFLIFNNTDTTLVLDETTGNYLRIQGVTFTQNSERQLTLDQFFEENANLGDVDRLATNVVKSPLVAEEKYYDIKSSRSIYGRNAFQVDAPFIQSADAAQDLMGWLVSKTTKPRKNVGLSLFGGSVLQLGDIVQIFWTDDFGVDQIVDRQRRFVVYHIEYSASPNGPRTLVYLSEVI